MIRDLGETLKAVIKDPTFATVFPELAAAEVAFDRPTEPFKLVNSQTTVDLFLYDVRENAVLRSNEVVVERRDGNAVSHPAPLRLDCSYLVTVFIAAAVADPMLAEHRVLTQVLRVLSRYPTIPPSFLKGSLVGQEPPLPLVALHPDALKNIAEFWSSLGSKLKASLTITATISLPVFLDVSDFLVTTHVTDASPAPPS